MTTSSARPVTDLPPYLEVAVVAVAVGVLTSLAQGWLPDELGSLANSVGPWAAVAFLLALRARRPGPAAVAGALAFLCLVTGYYVAAHVRGYAVGTSSVAFWCAVAVVGGPVLGLAAYVLRTGTPIAAAVAAGVPVGILLGEGGYGLRVIADTTWTPWWWGEVAAALLLLAGIAALRLRAPRPVAVAGVAGAVAGTVLFLLLRADVLSVV